MIDLSQSSAASPLVHSVATDPGLSWTKDAAVAIEVPPDAERDPRPETHWSAESPRTGVYGVVSPRVIALPGGGYRMYYSQILPRPGYPAGANDYDNSTTRILSASSEDGERWLPEPGVRLSPQVGGAGEFRVVSSEVVPVGDGRRLRMYYECCAGPQSVTNSIRSAVSTDGGLEWTPEPGVRWQAAGRNFSAPRIVFLDDGRCRLYCLERGRGIISAVSDAAGLVFESEPGLRIAQDGTYDSHAAFASDILRVANLGYVMYYAGYSQSNRAYILRAVSDDGLTWHKAAEPVISPGPGGLDGAKCSEMCVIRLPHREGAAPRYRMFYEACDGSAKDERGVWRIASATTNLYEHDDVITERSTSVP
ncbi:MAG: hypothetical protein JWN70_552 [Planctomycetaceae bacterium]|nr:hypothetical protein [Planctomycetaceae bacterium]